MRTRIAGVTALLTAMAGCAADVGDKSNEEAPVSDPAVIDSTTAAVVTPVVSPDGCRGFRGTLDEQVAAGRMGLVVTQFFIFPVKRYYLYDVASTTVGFDGTAVTTLYVTSAGSWSPDVTLCVPCGNGTIESSRGEECDGTNFGGKTCQSYGYSGGSLKCGPTCAIDTLGCGAGNPPPPPPPSVCGNGVIDGDEQCDGAARIPAYAGKQCKDLLFSDKTWPFNTPSYYKGGNIGCKVDCTIDLRSCIIPPGCYYTPPSSPASPGSFVCY